MMLKRLEDATASLGERSITSYMRSKVENVRGLVAVAVRTSAKAMQEEKRLKDATLLSYGLGQGTVFQTATRGAYIRARLHFIIPFGHDFQFRHTRL